MEVTVTEGTPIQQDSECMGVPSVTVTTFGNRFSTRTFKKWIGITFLS